jgi:hypothetical protein
MEFVSIAARAGFLSDFNACGNTLDVLYHRLAPVNNIKQYTCSAYVENIQEYAARGKKFVINYARHMADENSHLRHVNTVFLPDCRKNIITSCVPIVVSAVCTILDRCAAQTFLINYRSIFMSTAVGFRNHVRAYYSKPARRQH